MTDLVDYLRDRLEATEYRELADHIERVLLS